MRLGIILSMLFVGVATAEPRAVRPDAVVDLRDDQATRLVAGVWRYSDAQVVDSSHHRADGSTAPTHDIAPRAGAADFDDSSWPVVAPSSLEQRRGTGKLSFGWYRLKITLPETIESTPIRGSTAALEFVADDYAEIYIDGKLPLVPGGRGGQLPTGWNAPNRVILTRDARPGQSFSIAVFVANGPMSDPPGNYIWIRSATLDFYAPGHLPVAEPVKTEIVRFDSSLDGIIAPGTQAEKLAGDFGFCEGPVWFNGSLLFSDPNNNLIYRWNETEGVNIYRTHSGYAGADIGAYRQPGSNGLAVDRAGRLTICEHGNRRVSRLEIKGALTVLADQYEGKRLNSPNDLVYRSDDMLFFTDPFFGLPKFGDDPKRESPHTGVYAFKDGVLKLIVTDLTGPNGIALSPDEKYLYVANWDDHAKIIKRYELSRDGSASNGTVFADFADQPGEEALDGLKVDSSGNVYVSAPGGLWVLNAEGKRLGCVKTPELPANFAWGDDGKTLYLAARTGLYRIRLNVTGSGVPQITAKSE